MHETLKPYMTGSSDDFQDLLENSVCTLDDRKDAVLEIGIRGWDECLEILVSREDPVLLTQEGAQAWVNMASNGHTDCWMQMLNTFYNASETQADLWNEALAVGRADAELEGHWDVYALTTALEGIVAAKTPATVAQLAMIGMRIELMHGLDNGSANKDIAQAFATKHIVQAQQTRNVDNVFDEMNFALACNACR